MVDYLGWAATAVFVASYFCTSPGVLRRMQMTGALMWMAYAVVVHAAPVFVANLLVVCAAAWTATGSRPSRVVETSDRDRDGVGQPVCSRSPGQR
jgi:hypothetical protein